MLVVAAPASGQGLTSRRQAVDARIAELRAKAAAAESRAAQLGAEIAAVTTRIRSLEARVGDVSARLATLENDLALHERRLAKLNELFRLETERLEFLSRQYTLAVDRLNHRLVALYESDDPGTVDVLLAATSISNLLDRLVYVNEIGEQDGRIVTSVASAKDEVRRARERTKKVRAAVAAATRTILVRRNQVRAVRDQLLASQRTLASSRAGKSASLADARHSAAEHASEAAALAEVSATLSARIVAAQSSPATSSYAPPASSPSDSTVSSAGLIWPVSGPVVSGFGMRWGRMHEGIDIAAPTGAPIRAAASGSIIYSGWMGGYGNLVVIDHGGGLATAYAHLSSFGAGGHVAQGQTIGYVGCTGHCFGPHLHFEVRVNGSPVDPLGYL